MFKKLKKKITEEQSPQKNTQPQQQAQTPSKSTTPPIGNRSRSSSLSNRQDESTITPDDRENVNTPPTEPARPAGSVNGDEADSPQKPEAQSFAQKLQLRVPSMESLFRSPSKESLFRSPSKESLFHSPSKESLVRSASRESLNTLGDPESAATPTYDPPSDIESEAEDTIGSTDSLSKEQLHHRLRRMERSVSNYRGKYSELVTAYRTVQRDKEKIQAILSQCQDKSLRRIGELREELQMDQQAKKHLQEEFDAALEEKDQHITVLQTQVSLLKQRLHSDKGNADLTQLTTQAAERQVESEPQISTQELNTENTNLSNDGTGDASKTLDALQQRVRRQENLLQKCKEMLHTHKERSTQLASEKEALQEQLEKLEKIKEFQNVEKTRLITQLRDAKNLIEQLEQDKGMVIAETKRQMHETLEMKEEEIAQLRSRILQTTALREELQAQKEKSEKAGGKHHSDGLPEPTEFEYLRKVMFEYMMGRETKTMAKVITTVLKFPADQAQKILEKEESRPLGGYKVALSLCIAAMKKYFQIIHQVIVGAPKANSTFSVSVSSPGAIFKCRVHSNPEKRCTEMDMGRGNERSSSCGKTCRGDRENEWMGVSLARQDRANGSVLACAHRWKNVFYGSEHILPHGFCSIIPPNLQRNGRDLIPCYEEYKKKYGEEHGSCQAGIAGFFTECRGVFSAVFPDAFQELVVMGAPGSYYWTGTVKVLNLTDNTSYKLRDGSIGASRYSYLGYAVTAGHFSQPTATDVVGGAPQDGGVGKVYIFKTERGSLVKIFQASGKKMGSYFGSSLCAVDLNQDGLSDLLVGAPMFSEIRDEGHVAVFINKGNGVLEERVLLNGDNAYNAHFGESIAMLGDLDDDGFPDVAIGAPKEEDFAGAVYIYHGDAHGIVATYSMRLSGQNINPALRMFGQSISGNVDMDGNGYPDVTIGAFMSDNVVMLRARPVITVEILIFLPVSINITAPQCHDGSQHLNCLNVSACLRFRGKKVPGQIGLVYNLTADVTKREKGQQSRVVFALNGELTSHVNEQIQLSYNEEKCRHYMAYVRKEVKDVFSPIIFEAAYSLGEHVIDSKDDKELPALKPILRWKKGGKIAQRNQTVFERNCLSDDCAADLRLRGRLLLPGMDPKPYLALGSVKNISLNVSISNAGDDAYDTNVYFNFSRELYFIKMWQKVGEKKNWLA
ncbi:Integrin alpha-9 [Acipenser ruthenus]|uniref:Integrin alpha-9 n=1 Tax=Acipenser ruthenus TaxID=7906 RepID=A0A662YZD6_ACIRT|nr:Integrin alpha-9 [Acipenser ruthenus]